MDAVAEQAVLSGFDVIGSARTQGEDLHRLSEAWRSIVQESLRAAGIGLTDVRGWEERGDGALLTLPNALLGRVVDLSQRLHDVAVIHNRHRRPEIRLRMAVLSGPVPAEPTYARTKIDVARLLDAPVFKALIERCHTESADGAATGLIMSDHAFRTVFGGDHTEVVRQAEFAEVSVVAKELRATAWVRVPGFDARSVSAFVTEQRSEPSPGPARAVGGVVNQVLGGSNFGVQAHTVHGGVKQGWGHDDH